MYNVYNNIKSLLSGIKTNRNRFSCFSRVFRRSYLRQSNGAKNAHVKLFIIVHPHRLCMMRKQRTLKLFQ